MKKLGIAFVSDSDEKSIITARHQALSSVIHSLFACGALMLDEEKLESGETKVSLSIMVDDALQMPNEADNPGRNTIPRETYKRFHQLFPNVGI